MVGREKGTSARTAKFDFVTTVTTVCSSRRQADGVYFERQWANSLTRCTQTAKLGDEALANSRGRVARGVLILIFFSSFLSFCQMY